MAIKNFTNLKSVATLPCDIALIATLVWECRLFSDTDVLQGSVAMHIRCDGIFNNSFIANLLENLSVKIFWKSVKVWCRYSHEFGVTLFIGTVYIPTVRYNPSSNGHRKLIRNSSVCNLAQILCTFIYILTRQWRKQVKTVLCMFLNLNDTCYQSWVSYQRWRWAATTAWKTCCELRRLCPGAG